MDKKVICAIEFIGKDIDMKIDRPINSKHPKYGFVYEVNYGFVSNTLAADGEEIDAYLLGMDQPIDEVKGKCIAIIHRLDDDDDKLIIVPHGFEDITNEEIVSMTYFQERFFVSVILRKNSN